MGIGTLKYNIIKRILYYYLGLLKRDEFPTRCIISQYVISHSSLILLLLLIILYYILRYSAPSEQTTTIHIRPRPTALQFERLLHLYNSWQCSEHAFSSSPVIPERTNTNNNNSNHNNNISAVRVHLDEVQLFNVNIVVIIIIDIRTRRRYTPLQCCTIVMTVHEL